jgi:hypothetical protein
VLHRTVQINHQPDATNFQFIILAFIYCSTCFGRFRAHHQKLNDCSSSLWFYLRIVVTIVLCLWLGRPVGPTGPTTARLSPRNEGKTRGCTGMLSPNNGRMSGANKVSLFQADSLATYLLQCAQDSSIVAMDKTYLIELVRDMRPLLGPKRQKLPQQRPQAKVWDEIGEKLNVAGKYWNNNTNEIGYYLLSTYSRPIFNIGTFYIRMVTVVTNIYLSYTLYYITNVP